MTRDVKAGGTWRGASILLLLSHSPDSSDSLLEYVQLPRKNSGELHNSLKPSRYLPTIEETPQFSAVSRWAERLCNASGHQTARSQGHQLRSACERCFV